jgi:hypothetical protein
MTTRGALRSTHRLRPHEAKRIGGCPWSRSPLDFSWPSPRVPRARWANSSGRPCVPAEPPRSEERAQRLAELLNQRAEQDADFADALDIWRRRAADETGTAPPAAPGDVHNEISGDTQGTVVQARDIHGSITLGG